MVVLQDYYCDVSVWYQAWMTPSTQIVDGPTCTKHGAVAARALLAGGVSQEMSLSAATGRLTM